MKAITDILLAGQKITPLCEGASRIFQGCSTPHRCLTFQITSKLVNFDSCQMPAFYIKGMILRSAALLYIKSDTATLGDTETARNYCVSR